MSSSQKTIRIKLMAKFRPGMDGAGWMGRFPGCKPVWENCHFIFDRHERNYDWLVVWDDLPSVDGERHTLWEEQLACPRKNTILVTTEPSSIKIYGSRFLNQFGHVWTSQEPWAVSHHPGMIREQTSYVWFYAHSERGNYDAVRDHLPLDKSDDISAICSTKQQRHTLHRDRYNFVMSLKESIPEMELFGRGIRFVKEKADAIDPYKYHVAIENFYGPHHWTEKLADPFLGAAMPVYHGCPNAEDYFPPESFLRIDLTDPEQSAEKIRSAMRDGLYEKNLPAILESRRRVIEQYAPVVRISKLVNQLHDAAALPPGEDDTIASRHKVRKKSLINKLSYASEKIRAKTRHHFNKI